MSPQREASIVHLIAAIAHPSAIIRQMAGAEVDQLLADLRKGPVIGDDWCRADGCSAGRVLEAFGLNRERVCQRLCQMMEWYQQEFLRIGATCALGDLQYHDALPGLVRTLSVPDPPLYFAALRSLVRLQSCEAVPALCGLALDGVLPPRAIPVPALRSISGQERARLNALLAAWEWAQRHAPLPWFHPPSSYPLGLPESRAHALHEFCPGSRRQALQGFANASLEQLGEGSLAATVQSPFQVRPAAGKGDPRLFQAYFLALAARPIGVEDQRPALTAISGLVQIGDRQSQQVLAGFGSPWGFPWNSTEVRRLCRVESLRVRKSLGEAGGELIPAASPSGDRREVAPH